MQYISAINEHLLILLIKTTPEAVRKAVTIIILICTPRCALDCFRISAYFISSILSGSCLEGGFKQIRCPLGSSVSLYFLRNHMQVIAERIACFPSMFTHACISIEHYVKYTLLALTTALHRNFQQ